MPVDLGGLTSKRWLKTIGRFTLILGLAWSLILGLSITWNLTEQRIAVQNNALIMGRTAFQKDVLYRSWNSGHGGVYVPITAATQPNPYLDGYPGQNILLANGATYTLINPAYMTRQVFELQRETTGILGHITSLKPIRPQNAADEWETAALQSFEAGAREFYSEETLNGQPYLRYMSPLMVEGGCLKCHAVQGYRVGEVRGGISESVPLLPLQAISQSVVQPLILGHLAVWLAGLAGIIFFGVRLKSSLRQQASAEEKLFHMSTHDVLTGLHNRAFFEETLHQIDDLKNQPVAILAADVDGLKRTNDEFGHSAGDLLLQRAAAALQSSFRDGDTLARTGGDEFVVILPNTNSLQAEAILGRVREHLARHNQEHADQKPLSISLGIASTDTTGLLSEAMRLADRRMYEDKAAKKPNF